MGIIKDILEGLWGGIVPRTCEVCGTPLVGGERYMCLSCGMALPRTGMHLSPHRNPIAERLARTAPVGRCASWFYYDTDDIYAPLIRRAKYDDRPRMARDMGAMFASEILDSGIFDDVDVLVPVPMHPWRHLRRGYNQAYEIARGVASVTGHRIEKRAVRASLSHLSQTHMSRTGRAANVRGDFLPGNRRVLDSLTGANVMIVDDIFTTGATVEQVIRALGPRPARVSVLTLGLTRLH